MSNTENARPLRPKPVSNRSTVPARAVSNKSPVPPDDPRYSCTHVGSSRPSVRETGLKRDIKSQSKGEGKISTGWKVNGSATGNATRMSRPVNGPSVAPPTRPAPPIPKDVESVSSNRSPSSRSSMAAKTTGTKTPPKTAWVLSSARPFQTPASKRISSAPSSTSSTRTTTTVPGPSKIPTPKASPRAHVTTQTTPSKPPKRKPNTLQRSPKEVAPSTSTTITSSKLTTPKAKETPPSRLVSRIPTATPSGIKVVRRTSIRRPQVRPQLSPSKRPTPLDLSKAKAAIQLEQTTTSSKYTTSDYTTPESLPPHPNHSSPPPPANNESPKVVQRVINELRDQLTPSSTDSFASALSSPQSLNRTVDTYRTSEDISLQKSPLYAVFLVPSEPSFPPPAPPQTSRRNSAGTIFDDTEPRTLVSSPSEIGSSPSIQVSSSPSAGEWKLDPSKVVETLGIPTPSPSPSEKGSSPKRPVSVDSRRSSVGKIFDFSTTTKITRRKPPSISLSTRSALEISLGTIASSAIGAANSAHVRRFSAEKISPLPTPESIAKETKRLRTRYKIINELLQTEKAFLSDMHVLEDYYVNLTHECSILTPRHKQTIFGRLKNILSFGDEFYQNITKAALQYATMEESRVVEARFDELLEWDSETTIGDAFWTSMVRIEKAYNGYCTHHEEASQLLQDLEKNDAVKSWLEECKRRSVEHTKAWDIHSLIIKPVQRVLKYPLLLQELLNVTPWTHSDYTNLELANKEITKVAERINESKRRKEICDRILAKGRNAVKNINADLVKFGRRTDKIRSSLGVGPDYQDETSELYADLISRFAKQAIQVQVLARDLERWVKEYRVYLNSADNLISALKNWVAFDNILPRGFNMDYQTWNDFFIHMGNVSMKVFPVLEKTVHAKCIEPLEKLYDTFKGPAALIAKHNRKAVDFARFNSLKAKDETPDKKLIESAKTFQSLHESLLEELPIFLSLAGEFIEAIVNQFATAQSAWYRAWMDELAKFTSDALLPEKATTEAFVGIVADFLEHFEAQKETVDSFAIINGMAIKHASRAPSLARLASEEQARFAESRTSGIVSPPLSAASPGRLPRNPSVELPGYFPSIPASPVLLRDQKNRLRTFDSEIKSPDSPQRDKYIFKAFSLASFAGSSGRADGFPFLTFSTGQEFEVIVEKEDRWLARIPGSAEVGWIPKSHCIEILM